MRTAAQHRLDRFATACLAALPEGYPLPDAALRDEMRLRAHPRPLDSEIENSLRHMETEKRIHGTRTETGVVWTLTTAGRAWHEQHA